MAKGKKEKPVYVDDGRALADMSGVSGPRLTKTPGRPSSTAKEKWDTYWAAVKMMFLPMLCFIAGLVILYVILYVIFLLAY